MADVKISGLPASTVPLAGTEVLPIVQSSTTKKVSIANVTAGRAVSALSFAPTGSALPVNGVFLPDTNAVGIATNSEERLRISATGGVSIGNTVDPGATNLSVTGTITSVSTVTGTALIPSNATIPTNGVYLPAANSIGIATNSTNAVYINSSQNVGVGTVSPGTKLDVNGVMRSKTWSLSGAGVTGGTTDFSAGTVTTNANWGYYFVAPTGSGAIADYAFFNPAGTERARIPNAGGFQCVNSISVGNATPSTSGAGITFPATQSASSDANTLDDYEEGTWTPTISFGGASVGITYSFQQGTYTKIGNQVTASCVVNLSAKGSSTGNANIEGLPFVSNSTYYFVGVIRISAITCSGPVAVNTTPSATNLLYTTTSLLGIISVMTDTNFSNTSATMMTITYQV